MTETIALITNRRQIPIGEDKKARGWPGLSRKQMATRFPDKSIVIYIKKNRLNRRITTARVNNTTETIKEKPVQRIRSIEKARDWYSFPKLAKYIKGIGISADNNTKNVFFSMI